MTTDPELLELRVLIGRALSAGRDAEDHLRTVSTFQSKRSTWMRLLELGTPSGPTPAQAEKIANALDEFADHLQPAVVSLDDVALRSAAHTAKTWGAAVWQGTADLPAIYRELMSLLGTLGRCDTKLYLGRDVRGAPLE